MHILFDKLRTVITKILIILTIIFAAGMRDSQTAYALDNKKDVKARITAASDIKVLAILTDEEFQAVALSSGRILKHVESARQAIADGKKDDAAAHVNQGLKLIRIIENSVPKHRVTTEIKSGNISYRHEEDVALRYVDIYDEQHIEDIITPLIQARKKNDDSKNFAIEERESELTTPSENIAISEHTSMKLDIIIAQRMLEAAKKDLKAGKVEDADDDLFTLQDDAITFVSYMVELPLVEAADNLKLAQLQINDGLAAEALNALKLASDDLKDYEKEAGENRAKEVRQLHQEIDKLTKSVKNENGLMKIMGRSKKEIGIWWSKAVKWMRS